MQTELPFAPFPGLRLEVGEMLNPLVKVEWRTHEGSDREPHFFCIYEDWCPDGRTSYEAMTNFYKNQGWQLAEFGVNDR